MTRTAMIKTRMMEMGYSYISLSQATGIALRTLKRYVADPDLMRLGDLRAIHNRLRFSDEQLAKLGKTK